MKLLGDVDDGSFSVCNGRKWGRDESSLRDTPRNIFGTRYTVIARWRDYVRVRIKLKAARRPTCRIISFGIPPAVIVGLAVIVRGTRLPAAAAREMHTSRCGEMRAATASACDAAHRRVFRYDAHIVLYTSIYVTIQRHNFEHVAVYVWPRSNRRMSSRDIKRELHLPRAAREYITRGLAYHIFASRCLPIYFVIF